MKKNYSDNLVMYAGFGMLALLALLLRLTLVKYKTVDYYIWLSPWYEYLKVHGLHGFHNNFSNYNLPYLYLLYIGTLLPLPELVVIKGISIFFDIVLAYSVFLVVRHFYRDTFIPLFAAAITLFLPTVLLNGAMMGQCDGLYTSFLVFSFYFGIKRRYTWMWLLWAAAFIFKLQAIFFVPWPLIVSLRYRQWYQPLICIPVFILSALPAIMVGRPVGSILGIYKTQVGEFPKLTLNAPNFYQWVPDWLFHYFNNAGVILTAAIVVFIVLLVYYRNTYSDRQLLLVATLLVLVIPFFLPQMHERYFYPAEIFCLITAFVYRPAIWYAPLMQFASLMAYTPYLFARNPAVPQPPIVPLGIVAIFVLGMICHLTYQLFVSDRLQKTTLKLKAARGT